MAAFTTLGSIAAMQGCGSDTGGTGGETSSTTTSTPTTSSTSSTSTTSSSATNTGGTGGTGGTGTSTGGTGGTGLTMGASVDAPAALDATPDPTGTKVYFTAVDPTLGPGVFSAPADGSAGATALKVGAPFAAPFGIAIGTDGNQLYIADPGATGPSTNKDLGVIFSLPAAGGTPSALSGSEGTEPRSLEVVNEANADVLYFTGRDKTDGQVGVFKMPASGGAVTPVAKGNPFRDPCGIAVASDGTIYVADTVAAASFSASIVKVTSGGTASTFLPSLRVGYPAGVALSMNESVLYVSALDPATLTDQLLAIDIGTQSTSAITTGISMFTESAGLHRAKAANVFAWADSKAGAMGGKVFVFQ